MVKIWTDKSTFGAGELSPTMARRTDTQQHADGAKRMRNVRLLNAGGFTRRPGSLHLAFLQSGARLVEFTFAIDQQYLLVFSAGRMDAYLTDGSAAGSLTGCPWNADDVPAMTWVQSGDAVFLACRAFHPQVVRRTGASSWTREAWTADEGPGGAAKQPYYKFADLACTITPSASSGSVTIAASEAAFQSGHVGQRIRYVGSEIAITAVTDATHAAGTVLQTLPPSQRLTMQNTNGFRVTHIVEGRESAAKGEIVAVDTGAGTIDVVIIDGEITFKADEEVTSPLGSSSTTAVAGISPLAARDWDEPYLSPVYGYPGAVGLHRARLWLGGHTRLPSSVLASRVGAHYDFDLGAAEDADAIFEDLGDAAVAWIRHFASAEHLLVLTDQGAYYLPESPANPIRPTSVTFPKIGAHGVGGVRPQSFDEGVLYLHASGAGVMDVRPTGDTVKSWTAADLALLAAHLIRTPVDMAATHGADGAPERYAYVVNSDGTLSVMHSIQSQQVLGWSLWETDGAYRSVAVLGGAVFAVVEREFDGTARWCLESFDQGMTLDGAVVVDAGGDPVALFSGMTVHARAGTAAYGTVDVDGTGAYADPSDGADGLEVGRFYRPTVETQPPEPKLPSGGTAGHIKRISRVRLYVHDAVRVKVAGRMMEAYRVGEDMAVAPPPRTEWIEATLLGRAREPTITITQDEPLPATILGISMEVII